MDQNGPYNKGIKDQDIPYGPTMGPPRSRARTKMDLQINLSKQTLGDQIDSMDRNGPYKGTRDQDIPLPRLIGLAFSAAIGITLLVLGCALPQFNNWWPMFVLFFYVLSPVPTIIARRYADSVEASSALIEMCIFITSGIVISAYGLPIVLAHTPLTTPVIQWGACGLALAGNTVVFFTILGYFYVFSNDDFDYSMW